MQKKSQKKSQTTISINFILVLVFVIVIVAYYISIPIYKDNQLRKSSFEDLLETSPQTQLENIPYTPPVIVQTYNNPQYEIPSYESKPKISKPNPKEMSYDNFLDYIRTKNISGTYGINNIVNEILVYMGYTPNLLNVIITDIDQTNAKTSGSYSLGTFNFTTGDLSINQSMLNKIDKETLIGVLIHEIDHFDKIAKLCKAIGLNEFNSLFKEKNIKINNEFWEKASNQANTQNFDTEKYKDALVRIITQNDIELISSYSNFYRLSENLRNPLEISAYNASDYVAIHYKAPTNDGPMKKLVKLFNSIDWTIYNKISSNDILKDERITIFDYLYANAIIEKYPNYSMIYKDCLNKYDGNLTKFWITFENNMPGFYQKGKMDQKTYDEIYEILKITETKAGHELSKKEQQEALKTKMNTLKANLVYNNAVKNLRSTTLAYLKFLKINNMAYPKDELNCILTLICIDNNITSENKTDEISLYYLTLPKELESIYKISNKNKRYNFIYDNQEFTRLLNDTKDNYQNLLVKLLEQNRLNIVTKH